MIVKNIFNIHIHHNWNPNIPVAYHADIAVLVVGDRIIFDNYIQPICLISSDSPPESITTGIVVGYGKSENETIIHEREPKVIELPIQRNDKCFIKYPDLTRISSLKTFCAGTEKGTGVCHGDSGSGLVVEYEGAYYLRGIVSASLLNKVNGCDVDIYSVFTDVLFYKDWIDKIDIEDSEFEYSENLK